MNSKGGLYMHDHALDHRPWPAPEDRPSEDALALTHRMRPSERADAREALMDVMGVRPEGRATAMAPLAVDLLRGL